ncbi:cyp108 [Symbiodinium microadriaticum]|nr:cyp108 [Symbiodinium microadriaticum]
MADLAPHQLDITTPAAYADFDGLHAKFRRLRNEAPVCFMEPDNYQPYWAVTKHADIIEIEGQPEKFINAPRLTLMDIETEEAIKEQTGGSRYIIRSLVDMDNPDHSKYRLLTQAWFMPKNLKALEENVKSLAKEIVDKMEEMGGECDFVKDVAVWYPLRVIMSILGVERKDEALMLKLTQELFGASDDDMSRDDSNFDTNVIVDYFNFFNALTAERRANPKDDVASVISNAKMDGELLPELECISYYIIVATAGHDTTSSSTSGGMLNLLRNPDQLQKLRDNPDLMGNAVEEMIRYETPVKHFFRTATEDYDLRGQKIKAGDSLAMFYPSANRDEEAFDDPDAFRIDREIPKNMAFGHGPHLCLGMHLARMEIAALYTELLSRVKSIELAGEPQWVESVMADITIRNPQFDFSGDLDLEILPGNPDFSAFQHGLSMTMPFLEPYLIRTMRTALKELQMGDVADDVRAFCGQEGNHYRNHIAMNDAIKRLVGEPFASQLGEIEERLEADYQRFTADKTLRFNLAYAEGFEAMTFSGVRTSIRTGMLGDMLPWAGEMWAWHLAEEAEHRTVTYDAYDAIGGGYFYRLGVGTWSQGHFQLYWGRFANVVCQAMTGRKLKFSGIAPFMRENLKDFLPTLLPTYNPGKYDMPPEAAGILAAFDS